MCTYLVWVDNLKNLDILTRISLKPLHNETCKMLSLQRPLRRNFIGAAIYLIRGLTKSKNMGITFMYVHVDDEWKKISTASSVEDETFLR